MSIRIRRREGCKGWQVDLHVELPDGSKRRFRKLVDAASKERVRSWAEERQALLFAELRRPKETQRKEAPTLAEFRDGFLERYCEAERQKQSGIESKRSVFRTYLTPILGDRKLDQINSEDIARLKASMASLSPKTVNNTLCVLSKALKVAVSWGILEQQPCRITLLKYQAPEMGFYDFDQYSKLVEAAGKLSSSHLVTVLLAGDAGLRSGEITGLEWPDLNLERGVTTIQRAEWEGKVDLPKGGRMRRVPMTELLRSALKEHRSKTLLRGKRVLRAPKGGPATQETLREWVAQAQTRAVLGEVTGGIAGGVHVLRHTFCSHLAMKGAPARAIQELAGHADLKTTQRYMHLTPAAKDAAIRLLDNRAEGAETHVPYTSQSRGETETASDSAV